MPFVVLFMTLLTQPDFDRPVVEPAKPVSPADEALALYARAILHERDSELFQALKSLESARKLDPDRHAVHKVLAQLYLALDRSEEALVAATRALELDPRDSETATLHARHLRSLKRYKDAADVLASSLARLAPQDSPETRARIALDLALVCEEAGDHERAEVAYRTTLTALEQCRNLPGGGNLSARDLVLLGADTRERLARVYTQRDKPAEAIQAFEQAKKLDPERAGRLSLVLAGLLEKQRRLVPALEAVEEYLLGQPTEIEAYEQKARLLHALDRGGEVVAFLEVAAKRDPYNLPLQIVLGKEYVRGGRGGDAERHYSGVFRSSPTAEVASALVERFKADREGGAQRLLVVLDEAIRKGIGKEGDEDEKPMRADPAYAAQARALLTALKQDAALTGRVLQAGAGRLKSGGDLEYTTRESLAMLAARTHQLDLAETLYRSCLRQVVGGGREEKEAQIYAGLLSVLGHARKYKDIVEVCRTGLKGAKATNRVLFHLELSRAEVALGNAREGLKAADEAVNESNDHSRLMARRNRAILLAEVGKVNAGIAECQALFKEYNQPGDVRRIRHALSSVYAAGRDLPKAEEQLKLILDEDPTDAQACNNLGYHYAEENRNLDEAERLVRKAIDLDRRQRRSGSEIGTDSDHENPGYLDSLGWVLFRQGKIAAARTELERATRLPGGDDDPVVWDHLGDALARLGEPNAARSAYEKALRLYQSGARSRLDDAPTEIRKKLKLLQP